MTDSNETGADQGVPADGAPSGPEWHAPKPEIIPEATYAPAMLALGVVLLLWGIVTMWIVSAAGLVLVVLAIARWLGGMRHDLRRQIDERQ